METVYVMTPGTYTDHTQIHTQLARLCDKVDALSLEIKETRKLMEEHDKWERKGEYIAPSAPPKYTEFVGMN